MSQRTASDRPLYVRYPESDGKPLAENTRQWRWIYSIAGGLDAVFAAQPDVFVAGNLLWYPVEGRPDIRIAPDALVAFGRPKGDRGSYLQWLEGGIAPQVVFEVLSPGNRHAEMVRKFKFYEQYGVEEYYIYDPDTNELAGWQRAGHELVAIDPINGWVSPRLNIRLVVGVDELELYRADGRRLPGYAEMTFGHEQLLAEAEHARRQLVEERALLEQERERAEQARRQLAEERDRAEQEQHRAERLAARLRTLGVDPDGDM